MTLTCGCILDDKTFMHITMCERHDPNPLIPEVISPVTTVVELPTTTVVELPGEFTDSEHKVRYFGDKRACLQGNLAKAIKDLTPNTQVIPVRSDIVLTMIPEPKPQVKGFNKDNECLVCGSEVNPTRQESGCPTCILASLYNRDSAQEKVIDSRIIEENLYRAYFTEDTKSVSSLTDSELNTLIQNIIQVQAELDKKVKRTRITRQVAESEAIRRHPKTKVPSGVGKDDVVKEPKERMTKEEKAIKECEKAGIVFADLFKFD
jgi:hypothetical protein